MTTESENRLERLLEAIIVKMDAQEARESRIVAIVESIRDERRGVYDQLATLTAIVKSHETRISLWERSN